MNVGILSWQNENGLTPYPLVASFGIDDFLLDANFIQFNNFIPTLNSIKVSEEHISINITFDKIVKEISLNLSSFSVGMSVAIYDGTRFLGRLTFGNGAYTMWQQYVNQTLKVGKKFLPLVVRSIPSNVGVFSLGKTFGDVTVSPDNNIHFTQTGQQVTIDAYSVLSPLNQNVLKTLNSVAPIANNVFIQDSDLLKIAVSGSNTITISLIGTAITDVVTELFTVIPTIP